MKPLAALSLASAIIVSAGFVRAEHEGTEPILPELPHSPMINPTTVPANGDVNPYGVAFVPPFFPFGGAALPGDILVSNFNASSNLQGTGSTIVSIGPNGRQHLFFQGPATGLGLTTALGVLDRGVVLVGNLPTPDGSCAMIAAPGSLIAIDRHGHQIGNLVSSSTLDGPWDLTVYEGEGRSLVFVSNVLSGTVTRLEVSVALDGEHLTVLNQTQIASGYGHRCDSGALVVGPTGVAYDAHKDLLYVASTEDNAIYSIPGAAGTPSDHGQGTLVYQDDLHLRGPLGLVIAPNGDLITTNGDAINPDPSGIQVSEMVEFTPSGHFVAELPVDPAATGGAFGIATAGPAGAERLAAVDDVTNTLKVWFVH